MAIVALDAQRLVDVLRGALLACGQLLFGFEAFLQDGQEWSKVWARLLPSPVVEGLAFKAQRSLHAGSQRSRISFYSGLRTRRTIQLNEVEGVAYNAGYESRSSFVRAFRKAYNVDPSEYRQRMKNGESNKGA